MIATAFTSSASRGRPVPGFTLVEVAIAIFVVTLLLGGILVPLSAQVEQRQTSETQKYLEEIKEALIGFAVSNNRLPCPASATSAGVESPSGGGTCTNSYNGFVPAVTLGLAVVDNQGFAVDPWGNRIRYAVTAWTPTAAPCNPATPPFTTTNGMSTYFSCPLAPNLLVCSIASTSATACSVAGSALSSGVPAIIYSTGKNGAYGGTGLDEAANPNANSVNNDRVFVSHVPAPSSAANGEFDDIMTWLSPNVLYNRMVAAGRLP